jgi:hypothetical protein
MGYFCGFLISVIFYIVWFISQKIEKKDIEPFIKNKCRSDCLGLTEIINKSNLSYSFQNFVEEQFAEICKSQSESIFINLQIQLTILRKIVGVIRFITIGLESLMIDETIRLAK